SRDGALMPNTVEVIECRDDDEARTWEIEIRKHRRTVLLHVAGRNAGWGGYQAGNFVAGGIHRGFIEAAVERRLTAYLQGRDSR
ncbi:MAG: hypothetical protein V2A73_02980, partial [Pseudomonadota bacterium]